MYERFQVEQKPGFASGTERYLLRWKFSMTTGGIEIDIGQRQHGAKRALCLCELSRAFVTISCSTHLLFISLHPFSFLFFFKRRISSQACRGQQQGNLAHYLFRVFVVFVLLLLFCSWGSVFWLINPPEQAGRGCITHRSRGGSSLITSSRSRAGGEIELAGTCPLLIFAQSYLEFLHDPRLDFNPTRS